MRYGQPSVADGSSDCSEAAATGPGRCRCTRNTPPARPRRRSTPCSARSPRCGACRRCASSSSYPRSTRVTSVRWRSASTTTGSRNGRPNKLVLSFHGVPRRTLGRGDPYHCDCQKTGALARRRARPQAASSMSITFQSRFGRGRVAQALYTVDAGCAGTDRIGRVDVVARASSATASRRWRRSPSRCRQRSCARAAASFTSFPA